MSSPRRSRRHAVCTFLALVLLPILLLACVSSPSLLLTRGQPQPPQSASSLPPLRAPVPQLNEAEFERMVHHGGRPVLVDFFAPWCGHCKTMAPLYEDAAVQMLAQTDESVKTQLVKVDCMDERALCQRFNVNAFPTLKLIRRGDESEGHDDVEAPLRVYSFGLQRTTLSFVTFCTTVWRTLGFTLYPDLVGGNTGGGGGGGGGGDLIDPAQKAIVREHEERQQQTAAQLHAVAAANRPAPPLTLEQRWHLQENERRAAEGLPPLPLPSPKTEAAAAAAPTHTPDPAVGDNQPTDSEQDTTQQQQQPSPLSAAAPSSDAVASQRQSPQLPLRKSRRLRRPGPSSSDHTPPPPPSGDSAPNLPSSVPLNVAGGHKLAAVLARAEQARAAAEAAAAAAQAATIAADEAEAAVAEVQQQQQQQLSSPIAEASVATDSLVAADGIALERGEDDEGEGEEVDTAASSDSVADSSSSGSTWWVLLLALAALGLLLGGGIVLQRHWGDIKRRSKRHHSLQLGKGV